VVRLYRTFGLVLVVLHAALAGAMLKVGGSWLSKIFGVLIYGSTAVWITLNIDEEDENDGV